MSFTYEYPHPAVTTDCVVFSIIGGVLSVALIERALDPFKGSWALPGGFVLMDEGLEEGARRELAEETGVTSQHLKGYPFLQVGTYGAPGRDPRERVITVAFMTLIPSDQVDLLASGDASNARWFATDALPPLAFDHANILNDARVALSRLVSSELPPQSKAVFSFLPEEFTLAQAQTVFEVIKGSDLDKRNFRKWILYNWPLVDLDKKVALGRHRPAGLFRFPTTD